MQLNQLRDKPGASKARTRVGRGSGSGKGTTAGRGNKGQKSRSGVSIKGFEGGQMPLYRRLPKRGFNPRNPKKFAVVNVGDVQRAIDAGRLDAAKPIDGSVLEASGMVRASRDGIRLLAKGELSAKVTIAVDYASPSAVSAVEKAGGSVTVSNANQDKPAKPAKKKEKSKPKSETEEASK